MVGSWPDSVKTFVAFECSARLASIITASTSASIVVRLAIAVTNAVATERTSFVVRSSAAINHITMVSHNLSFVGTFLNFFAIF